MSQHQRQPNLDTVTTINEDGSRYVIHPSDVKGKFTIMRRLTAWVLVAVYIITPWIKIGDHPIVFFDVQKLQFHLFGLTLFAGDMWMMMFLIIGGAFTLFVLSAVVGRVWCGWYCPYTVFLEHVYRRVERWIDGDSVKRRKLDKAPWKGAKIMKRVLKWGFYLIISLILANVFLSYFISIPELWSHMKSGPLDHIKEFIFIVAFTAVFTFMFGWFREQFCIILCPYGRFQSALTDDDTITVTYDYKRGEPRGKKTKKQLVDKMVGDCIDCRRCVSVCPTGIDIRNGIQLECVACSSCIDACNNIMTKIGKPKGLIRYDSNNGIETGKKKVLRPRLYLYAFFIVLGASVLTLSVFNKFRPFQVDVARVPGTSYVSNQDGVRNLFTLEVSNKRHEPLTFKFDGEGPAEIQFSKVGDMIIQPLETKKCTVRVYTSRDGYDGAKDISFVVTGEDGSAIVKEARFTGPNVYQYQQQFENNNNDKPEKNSQ